MKKIVLFLMLALLSCPAMHAQYAAFKQSVAKYRTVKSAVASAVMTKGNKVMKKTKKATGYLYMKDPDKVAISVNNGKDQLVMNGNTFTMVTNGRKHIANATTAAQFAAFKQVFQSVLSGGNINVDKIPGVSITQNNGNVVVTMIPSKQKRMMFTSFILTIDKTSNSLESLRMNGKRGYTLYTFGNFRFGAAVNNKVFSL